MNLISSWQDIIKPDNLKLLFLVTLNAIKRHYKFFMGVILVPLILLGLYFVGIFLPAIGTLSGFLGQIYYWFLIIYLPFIVSLIVRPSIKLKTLEYFLDYKFNFLLWGFIAVFNLAIFVGALSFFPVFIKPQFGLLISCPIIFAFSVAQIFFVMFWLDSRLSIKNLFLSCNRATKMFIFDFLPIYFIFLVIPYYIFIFLTHILARILGVGSFLNYFAKHLASAQGPVFLTEQILVLAIYIFVACFLVNFYTKKIHDKFNFYFGE